MRSSSVSHGARSFTKTLESSSPLAATVFPNFTSQNPDRKAFKVPEVPIGRVLIQVVAKGYHTYGKWYDIAKDPDLISIKLDPPPHWY